jgi:hypothetical protein
MGIGIEYIPDGHAYYISVFRNNASATVFKMEVMLVVYVHSISRHGTSYVVVLNID